MNKDFICYYRNMEIKEINSKDVWERFLLESKEKTFLQSWNWGEFQKDVEDKIWRPGVYDGGLKAAALVIKVKAKRGTFLFIPHGPIGEKNIFPVLIEELKKLARKEKASFIRVAPIWERTQENKKIFKDLSFRNAPTHMHAEATWRLDLRPSEEELLMNMRKTTRYLIRKAQKNEDIQILQSKKVEDIEIFNEIHQEVVKKHHFTPFSLGYLKNEFSAFNQDNKISLFLGKYKNKIIASAFVIFWSRMGFYHHAALSVKYHKIPIAYLLQWEAIREAKRRGCVLYDFWGYVSPKEQPNHPWAGPTLFKMGFGGYKEEYVKTQDLPLSLRYWPTKFFERLRGIKRGL